jgi:hypothetical protein
VECGSRFYGKVGTWPPVGSLRQKSKYIKKKITLNLVIRFMRMLIKSNLIFQGSIGDTLLANGIGHNRTQKFYPKRSVFF